MTLRDMKRPAGWPKSGWYWHLHHDVLFEFTHDIDERWDYVVSEKSDHELPTRLRLMRPVAGKIPVAWAKADAELNKARYEGYKAYLSDLNEGSPAQRAFWALFADPANRSDAWN